MTVTEEEIRSHYCTFCGHPHGYHTEKRGCTMPVTVNGRAVSRGDETAAECGCIGSEKPLSVAEKAAAYDRLMRAAEALSDAAAYKIARMAGSVHACEVEGCNLSQEEHHRLAYGILNENKELRRRNAILENGGASDD